jgi:photosystem II stability/assembly factor-like uncharacterized protein
MRAELNAEELAMGARLCLLVGNQNGLTRLLSDNNGEQWSAPEQHLAGTHICAVASTDNGTVYVGARDHGLLRSDGDLTRWQSVNTLTEAETIRSLCVVGDKLLVGTEPAAVYEYAPRTGVWSTMGDIWDCAGASEWFYPVPTEKVHTRYLAVDPTRADRLYAAVQVGGVAISSDGGKTWSDRRNLDLDVHMIEPHPTMAGVIFAGTGGDGLFRSGDYGETWTKISEPCGNFVVQFALTPGDPERIYLGTGQGHPPMWTRPERARGELFRSTDAGAHWSKLTGGLPDTLHSRISALWVDPQSTELVFAGAGLTFRDLKPSDSGVYASTDGGKNWRKLLDAAEPEFIWTGRI